VDQIVGGVGGVERRTERLGPQHVAGDDLDPLTPGTTIEASRVAREAADVATVCQKMRHEPPADVTGRPGDQDGLHEGTVAGTRSGRRWRKAPDPVAVT